MKPAIGITTRRLQTETRHLDVVEQAYADAVFGAGGIPRLLPCRGEPSELDELQGIGGLLLTGGGDVDPVLYGAVRSNQVGGVDRERDTWEMGLLRLALRASVPVLGICRGNQILNVAFGGTLIEHLPDLTAQPHLVPERERIVHRVRIEPGTRLFGVEQRTEICVNSIHHQAVGIVAPDLRASAWSDDGVIEAVEHPRLPVLGVQWHPENLFHEPAHLALFQWLVNQAACAGQESDADAHER